MGVKKRQKTLSHGRPPTSRPRERMSSQQSRTIIRTHHRLHKELAAAVKKGDTKLADGISKSIEENGGLQVYQAASKQGQSKDRGGDSSKVLVEWLREVNVLHSGQNAPGKSLRCLEVGALSTKNEISKFSSQVEMTRIDLNSQGLGIEKQDFMERPRPQSFDEAFDIISLSLVLNYVPDPVRRGEMLKRVAQFLRSPAPQEPTEKTITPALFLVLPLPCVENSRYLDEELLLRIMRSLGFAQTRRKITPKLCYHLFTLREERKLQKFEKRKVKDGRAMNNFCIIVD